MNRPPPRVHSDFQTLLDALSVRQYLAPHEPTGRSLARVIETLGVCPQAVGQAIDWLHLDPLQAIGRVEYVTASDDETLASLEELCASEGILPALESSHALAGAKRWAANNPGARVLIGLSGRGDKDMPILAQHPMKDARRDARDRAPHGAVAESPHAAA